MPWRGLENRVWRTPEGGNASKGSGTRFGGNRPRDGTFVQIVSRGCTAVASLVECAVSKPPTMTQPPPLPPEDSQPGVPFALQLFAPVALLAISVAVSRLFPLWSIGLFWAGVVAAFYYAIVCFAKVKREQGIALGLFALAITVLTYGSLAHAGCSYSMRGL